jgi:murein DD-endopeptidase MepM/ murein hydrolase activator NlpD
MSYADLSSAAGFVDDDGLPFRFPLDDLTSDSSPSFTLFCTSSSGPESSRKYHAAEDYFRPAGTPVYAIADGKIAFSGPMGGYGWLIIVEHPQANLYSLYGHLSPSRYRMRRGPVEKGTLLAYLGDAHENGGNAKRPLEPHLHLGLRAGQRADYPGKGEWRWQAGWIVPCPTALGWLQPSAIITSQEIPMGGFSPPTVSSSEWLAKWGIELLFGTLYTIASTGALI